jgi:hypothetical protein
MSNFVSLDSLMISYFPRRRYQLRNRTAPRRAESSLQLPCALRIVGVRPSTLSSSGLGHRPFTAVTRVRIPLGSPPGLWVAHASRVLAKAFSPSRTFQKHRVKERLFRRDAETSTRDACANQSPGAKRCRGRNALREQRYLTVFLSLKVGVGRLKAGPILIDSLPATRRSY